LACFGRDELMTLRSTPASQVNCELNVSAPDTDALTDFHIRERPLNQNVSTLIKPQIFNIDSPGY
jgi:hypothetical protein